MNEHVVLIQTKDQKGLIFKITEVMVQLNLNITDNSEYVDKNTKIFFLRMTVVGSVDKALILSKLRESLGDEGYINIVDKSTKKNVVIMVTKEIHCIGDLLIRYMSGELNINIQAVVGNHDLLREFVEKFGITYHCVSHENLSREAYEEKLLAQLAEYEIDVLVLAKYMRILSDHFVDTYKDKILNIHHSFLPAFIGANPYHRAYERGVKMIGATAHIVTGNLDEGPIIAQGVEHVDHNMTVEEMILLGQNVEKIVLSKAFRLVLEDRVFIENNKTVIL